MSNRKFLRLTIYTILIITNTALCLHAQQNPNANPNATPRPTPTPAPSTSRPIKRFPKDLNKELVLPGVSVKIIWHKELGLPYNPARPRPPYPVCSMFRVRITTQEAGTPGTFGVTRTLADFSLAGKLTNDGSSYVCTGISLDPSLPLNKPMVITAELDSRVLRGVENGPWQAGSDAAPPPGQHRAIIIVGGRTNNGITLTKDQPRQSVEFEMVYRPNPEPPR